MEKEEGVVRNEGIDRRRLLKRGAVVGGTLLWAAPLIQSIGPAAQAHTVGSPVFGCCQCTGCGAPSPTRCGSNGCLPQAQCQVICVASGCTGPSEAHCGPDHINCVDGLCEAH